MSEPRETDPLRWTKTDPSWAGGGVFWRPPARAQAASGDARLAVFAGRSGHWLREPARAGRGHRGAGHMLGGGPARRRFEHEPSRRARGPLLRLATRRARSCASRRAANLRRTLDRRHVFTLHARAGAPAGRAGPGQHRAERRLAPGVRGHDRTPPAAGRRERHAALRGQPDKREPSRHRRLLGRLELHARKRPNRRRASGPDAIHRTGR